MKNNKEALGNYKIREGIENRIFNGIMSLAVGTMGGKGLVDKTLEVASKMYNQMQTNADFNFHTNWEQFCNVQDRLETIAYTAIIIIGGAVLSHSLFAPKYEIYKENYAKNKFLRLK